MLDWDNIDTVLLDMDGTLLDLHFDNHFWLHFVPQKYAEKYAMKITQAKAHLTRKTTALRGKLDWYCVDYWSAELDLDIEALKHELQHKIAVLPHVTVFLSAVKQQNKTLALVTNAHQKSLKLKLDKTGLSGYFDQIISAHDLGLPKEDVRFWTALQQSIEFEPSRTLFVDDSLSVLQSASEYGIQHLLAVSKPDSQQGAQPIDGFMSVEHLGLVTPQ